MSCCPIPEPGEIWAARRRLRSLLRPTPLIRSHWIEESVGENCHLKLESLQPTGSFKIRGAYSKLSRGRSELGEAVITASSGNHGAAVAMAASHFGIGARAVVPVDTPAAKLRNIRRYGAEVVRRGAAYDEAEAFALAAAAQSGLTFVHPFCDRDIIAGQGTAALEVFDQIDPPVTFVVPTGGGGFISGITLAAGAVSPANAVVGVQPAASQPMVQSYRAGRLIEVSHHPT
ncbi:MAG: pyridoxal-phosphate dependent enzyme, partial [Bacillota bacterium]